MCLFIVCETVFTIGESRAVSMQMTQDSKVNKWLEILAAKIFHRNSFGERRLKFIASGEHDDNIVKLLCYNYLVGTLLQSFIILFDFSLCML